MPALDHRLAAFGDAIAAVAAAPDGDRGRLAAEVVGILSNLLPKTGPLPRTGKRGRRRVYDREWALSHLVEILSTDPDGLASPQSLFIDRLRSRFADHGRPVPGETWLKKTVGEFYT